MTELIRWASSDHVVVPSTSRTPGEIADFAKQLTARERDQIVQAFDNGLVEMGVSFVWSKAMAALKNRLGSLGIEFVAEMLERSDIRANAEIHEVLTDYDAVRLAEELGMFSSTLAMRLRQNMELVAHFSQLPQDAIDDEMIPEDAVSVLRTCVQTVLGQESLDVAVEFSEFRRRLEGNHLDDDAVEIQALAQAPYFYKRTVLRTLLASSRTSRGAQLENVLANLNTLLPAAWSQLKDPDRYMIGRAYADAHAEGLAVPASGIRSALLKVSGFDYVPESLRSAAYFDAAAKLLEAHFSWSNFYNEPAPMRALAALGTSIPRPAFHKCATAIIAVRIGNHYGVSNAAQADADRMLKAIGTDRWQYFFDSCLPVDSILLGKLSDSNVAQRWCGLVSDYTRAARTEPEHKLVRELLDASVESSPTKVTRLATKLQQRLRDAEA